MNGFAKIVGYSINDFLKVIKVLSSFSLLSDNGNVHLLAVSSVVIVVTDSPSCDRLWPEQDVLGPFRYVHHLVRILRILSYVMYIMRSIFFKTPYYFYHLFKKNNK